MAGVSGRWMLAVRAVESSKGYELVKVLLIEALTYRFRGHSLADPDELRSRLKNFGSPVID